MKKLISKVDTYYFSKIENWQTNCLFCPDSWKVTQFFQCFLYLVQTCGCGVSCGCISRGSCCGGCGIGCGRGCCCVSSCGCSGCCCIGSSCCGRSGCVISGIDVWFRFVWDFFYFILEFWKGLLHVKFMNYPIQNRYYVRNWKKVISQLFFCWAGDFGRFWMIPNIVLAQL
jgi:hypothetical protein